MVDITHLSWLAIAAATFVRMGIGMFWYHPKVFGSAWAASLNFRLESLEASGLDILKAALNALVTAFVLALFIEWTFVENFWQGALTGVWAAAGFVLTAMYSGVIWAKKPLATFFIDAGEQLLALALMGGVIGALT